MYTYISRITFIDSESLPSKDVLKDFCVFSKPACELAAFSSKRLFPGLVWLLCQDWIFAKDNYFLSNCGLTVSIQNSSNPKLNGEYFQEDRFHGCRPVFHCRGMQQYLFYNSSKKQWQIYKKLSGSLGTSWHQARTGALQTNKMLLLR